MRLNENTIICGDKVILVPYRTEHVPTYHEWMKSPELLELTASEPLSFEQELEMQKKWQLDDDKLTFILLARSGSPSSSPVLHPDEIKACPMVGDVNLFLPNGSQEDVECEIMIAAYAQETSHRRKGIAFEALTLFLAYVVQELKVKPQNFMARIGAKNESSQALFQRLGFHQTKYVAVWDEVEMRWNAPDFTGDEWSKSQLLNRVATYE